MLTLLLVFGYLLLGCIAMYVAAFIHLWNAEKKGYDALYYWRYEGSSITCDYIKNSKHEVIFGIIIWPVRLVQFYMDMDKYYELYGLKY